MDICFLSTLYPRECTKYDKNVVLHRSQNISFIQFELIKGLEEATGKAVHIINKLLVPLYRKGYKSPVVKAGYFEHTTCLKRKDVIFPYINIPFFHSISLFFGARKYIHKWMIEEKDEEKYLIAYALTTYALKAMAYAKKTNPDIKNLYYSAGHSAIYI